MSELTIPSGISFEPSEDERMMIDSVRRYCQTEIAAFVKAHGAENYIPTEKMRELLKGLTEFGFVGGPIAQEHGGLGLSWKTFGLLLEELCAVSLSIASPPSSRPWSPPWRRSCWRPNCAPSTCRRSFPATPSAASVSASRT
jgi:hypothetical protein